MKLFFVRTHAGMSDQQHILCALLGIYTGLTMLVLLLLGVFQSLLALSTLFTVSLIALMFYATMTWHEHRLQKGAEVEVSTSDHVFT